ncbi:hypothetical protein sS8_0146 [Methylocaldum marinum]|uniref:Uncharacterized protein n=1 Tax=Methylocaldum marinum TaxID=1432792 RepID=A0A286P392_9GAMM|nr:hypothetical protein sS8_0146 [Methylocaldum marinum]
MGAGTGFGADHPCLKRPRSIPQSSLELSAYADYKLDDTAPVVRALADITGARVITVVR